MSSVKVFASYHGSGTEALEWGGRLVDKLITSVPTMDPTLRLRWWIEVLPSVFPSTIEHLGAILERHVPNLVLKHPPEELLRMLGNEHWDEELQLGVSGYYHAATQELYRRMEVDPLGALLPWPSLQYKLRWLKTQDHRPGPPILRPEQITLEAWKEDIRQQALKELVEQYRFGGHATLVYQTLCRAVGAEFRFYQKRDTALAQRLRADREQLAALDVVTIGAIHRDTLLAALAELGVPATLEWWEPGLCRNTPTFNLSPLDIPEPWEEVSKRCIAGEFVLQRLYEQTPQVADEQALLASLLQVISQLSGDQLVTILEQMVTDAVRKGLDAMKQESLELLRDYGVSAELLRTARLE